MVSHGTLLMSSRKVVIDSKVTISIFGNKVDYEQTKETRHKGFQL